MQSCAETNVTGQGSFSEIVQLIKQTKVAKKQSYSFWSFPEEGVHQAPPVTTLSQPCYRDYEAICHRFYRFYPPPPLIQDWEP